MFVHTLNNDTVSDPSWHLKYGNYRITGAEEAQAMLASNAIVTSVDIVYDKKCRLLRYFPKGTFFCSKCQKHVEMSANKPAYLKHMEYRVFDTNHLFCHDCVDNEHTYLCICFQFDTLCSLRYQAKKRADNVAEQRALFRLRYPIMEWACQLYGPCYRVALSRWPTS